MTTQELKGQIDRILGNSIRCLLPSYWWKKLFHTVVDEIDDVRSTANSKASKLEVDALSNKIDNINPTTDIRTIYDSTAEYFTEEQREYNKESYRIIMEGGYPEFLVGGASVSYSIEGDKVAFVISVIQCSAEVRYSFYYTFYLLADGSIEGSEIIDAAVPEVCYLHDPELAMMFFQFPFWGLKGIVVMGLGDVCYVDTVNYANREVEFMHGDKRYRVSFDEEYNIGTPVEIPISGGLPIYIALGNASLTAEQIASNKNTLANIHKEIPYAVFEYGINGEKISFKYPIALYFANTTGTSFYITDWDSGTRDLLGFRLNSDGTVTRVDDKKSGGLEFRSFKSTNSATDKEWNKETISLFLEGKVNIVYPYPYPDGVLPEGTSVVLMPNTHIYQNGTHQFWFTEQHATGGYTDYGVAIQSDGTYDDDVEVFKPDTEMSYTSTNTVQNKVIKAYVDTEVAKKVDKVSGKGLSTEDFTTVLKTKLEGLKNYDDTTLTNAISSLETRLNTLVSGDTSTAIESFNEVVAFLENLTDTQDLSSIIASIEQQINAKQDKINDLNDIRSGASLGKTSIQEHQDISHLATKEEVQNVVDGVLETEEVYAAAVNDLNTRIVNTENSVTSEIANRESLQAEFQEFKTQVTDNEEVWATSLTDINTRIDTNYQYGEDTYATKESLNTEIQTINTTILDNEEVIAATLTDLNNQIASLNALIADLTTRIETLENA